jgi:hypothetical protein
MASVWWSSLQPRGARRGWRLLELSRRAAGPLSSSARHLCLPPRQPRDLACEARRAVMAAVNFGIPPPRLHSSPSPPHRPASLYC